MDTRKTLTLAPSLLVLALLVAGCRDDAASPGQPVIGGPSAGVLPLPPPPPPKKDKGGQPANFRLTGGGRIDKPHPFTDKNTPQSRDFATFGFQARPAGSGTTAGDGNITWVEHNPAAVGGGFTFHGRVEMFEAHPSDADCGRFSGTGRAHLRDGRTFEGLSFMVEHACDKGEPGVGRDHIRMVIPAGGYDRDGILTGGNIQKHKL